MSDFFAASMPFLIAEGTSFALPTPNPTTPWPSPTTTSALKLRFLPPLTTLVTRLMLTTVSLRSSCDASIFSLVSNICSLYPRNPRLELQPRFARGIRDRLDPAVIEIAAAIEDHPLDALLDRALGDGLAQRLGAGEVAAAHLGREHRLQHRLGARRRGQRRAAHVVDDLRVDVRDAAEH